MHTKTAITMMFGNPRHRLRRRHRPVFRRGPVVARPAQLLMARRQLLRHPHQLRSGEIVTNLTPVKSIPAYAVIIRAIHERGPVQEEALDELARRRLWLSEDQAEMAGVSRERAGLGKA